jgi:molecular chaperone DnaK
MAEDNKTLGRFILDGIPPAPRGVPQVEVAFDIDANGIVNVSAKDKASGKEQKITITSSSGLSEEEVEKMKKDAEVHAEEDKKKRELIEAKNIAENLIYTAEKSLKDLPAGQAGAGDKVDSNKKTEVEDKIKALKDVLTEDNAEVIKNSTEALSKVLQELGASMYQSASAEPNRDGQASQNEAGEKKKEEGDKSAEDEKPAEESKEEKPKESDNS